MTDLITGALDYPEPDLPDATLIRDALLQEMNAADPSGTDWSDDEIDLIVAD
jgi:hypothetical protein